MSKEFKKIGDAALSGVAGAVALTTGVGAIVLPKRMRSAPAQAGTPDWASLGELGQLRA